MTTINFGQGTGGSSKGDFIEIITPNSTMSTDEQTRWDSIMNNPYTDTIYHVIINPIEDFLSAKELEVKLPGTQTIITFEADYVKSSSEDDYYWYGYSSDGSIFEMMKMVAPSEPSPGQQTTEYYYLGNITLINETYSYRILDLSPSKKICVKYDYPALNQTITCTQTGDDSDDGSDEVEDRGSCPDNNIRVLFLFNTDAAIVGNPVIEANMTIQQLNNTAISSNVSPDEISFEFVDVLPLAFTKTNNIGNDLNSLISNNNAKSLRDNNFADVVILFVEASYPTSLGAVLEINPKEDKAFAIMDINTTTGAFFSGVHEVSHLLGARHERCSACNNSAACDNKKKFHGVLLAGGGNVSETVMANCFGRMDVLRWSNDEEEAFFMGSSSGDNNNDNVRIIRRKADNVACFRDDPPEPNGSITNASINSGSNELCRNTGTGLYYANFSQSNLTYPISYFWDISPNGISAFTTVQTGTSSILTLNAATLSSLFTTTVFIRVKIVDASGQIGVAIYEVNLIDCLNGEVDNRSDSSTEDNKNKILIYPNPATDKLQFSGLKIGDMVSVFDTKGNLLVAYQDLSYPIIDIASWPTGLYIIKIQTNTSSKTLKFCKI